MRLLAGFLLAGLALVPIADGVPLAATLRGARSAAVDGLLSLETPGLGGYAVAQFVENPGPADARFVEAQGIQVVVHRWVDGTGCLECKVQLGRAPDSNVTSYDVTDATLDLRLLRSAAQMALIEATSSPAAASTLDATGERCAVDHPAADSRYEFPQDPTRVSGASMQPLVPGGQHLEAACQVKRLEATNPGSVWFYGMDLFLDAREREELIKTGTYEEPNALTGLPQRVTTVLELRYQGLTFVASLVQPTRVHVYANAFLALGTLDVSRSQGSLQWGELNQTGEVDPFSASGSFRLAWAENRFVAFEGSATAGPAAAPDSWAETPWAVSAIVIASATGLGLLALLGRAIWSLYSTLKPEEILNHPRRAQILEYVRADPGVHTNVVARALGLRWPKAVYHIGRLERGGYLTRHRIGGRTALFPSRAGFAGKEERVALLRRPTLARIHRTLLDQPRLDQAGLALALGLTRQHVSESVRRLCAAGLVRTERQGRRRRYLAVPS